jgi:hypothetical protein
MSGTGYNDNALDIKCGENHDVCIKESGIQRNDGTALAQANSSRSKYRRMACTWIRKDRSQWCASQELQSRHLAIGGVLDLKRTMHDARCAVRCWGSASCAAGRPSTTALA